MAEASLSVSVPAWRLRTDAEIGGGIAKLKVANLRKRNNDRRQARLLPALNCTGLSLLLELGICNCACVGGKQLPRTAHALYAALLWTIKL